MKLPTTKTIKLGEAIIENTETGEEIILGKMPTLKVVISEPKGKRDRKPALEVSARFTWWSLVKMRLFIWRTGFVSRYYCRKWSK